MELILSYPAADWVVPKEAVISQLQKNTMNNFNGFLAPYAAFDRPNKKR
jgi:hypothetical protein